MSRYLIIIEETATGYSAYSPDLPGCIAAGKARDSVEREMHDAIEFHLDGLRRAGEPIPTPRSQASYCEIGASFRSRQNELPKEANDSESWETVSTAESAQCS